jgi:hypothetical protein
MKIKDLIEKLNDYPPDMEVLIDYANRDGHCIVVSHLDFYTNEVMRTVYGSYFYEEVYFENILVPYTKETALIISI